MRKVFLIGVLFAIAIQFNTATAQKSLKVAHVDLDTIIALHPDKDSIETILNDKMKSYDAMLQDMVNEILELREKLATMDPNLPPEWVQKKQGEYEQKVNEYQTQSDGRTNYLMGLEQQYLTPVIEDIQATVKIVAEREGYNYVINGNLDTIFLYVSEKTDITALVLKELGVTAKPATPSTPTPGTGN